MKTREQNGKLHDDVGAHPPPHTHRFSKGQEQFIENKNDI
jgi:hypothetical protein